MRAAPLYCHLYFHWVFSSPTTQSTNGERERQRRGAWLGSGHDLLVTQVTDRSRLRRMLEFRSPIVHLDAVLNDVATEHVPPISYESSRLRIEIKP